MSEQDRLKYIAEMRAEAEKNIRSVVRLDNGPKSIPVYFSKFEIKWLAHIVTLCRNEAIDDNGSAYYGGDGKYIAGMNELLHRFRQALKSSEPEREEEE